MSNFKVDESQIGAKMSPDETELPSDSSDKTKWFIRSYELRRSTVSLLYARWSLDEDNEPQSALNDVPDEAWWVLMSVNDL